MRLGLRVSGRELLYRLRESVEVEGLGWVFGVSGWVLFYVLLYSGWGVGLVGVAMGFLFGWGLGRGCQGR